MDDPDVARADDTDLDSLHGETIASAAKACQSAPQGRELGVLGLEAQERQVGAELGVEGPQLPQILHRVVRRVLRNRRPDALREQVKLFRHPGVQDHRPPERRRARTRSSHPMIG